MFTLLMITREGMETALLMNALLFTVKSPQIVDRRRRRDGSRRVRRLALVALRPPRQPRALLPGHGGFPADFRRAARDLRIPRARRSQHLPEQPALARCDRAVRPGRHLRSVSDLSARPPARSRGWRFRACSIEADRTRRRRRKPAPRASRTPGRDARGIGPASGRSSIAFRICSWRTLLRTSHRRWSS